MERDRDAALTLKAAARGVIDFSKAEIKDANWWRKWRYLLETVENQDHESILSNLFNFYLAQVSNSAVKDLNKCQQNALDIYDKIINCAKPWSESAKQQQLQEEAVEFSQHWQRIFGWDPTDKQALDAWSKELKGTMQSKREERENQGKLAQEKFDAFHAKAEEIRRKRLNQQGH